MGFAASNKDIIYSVIPADNVGLILSGLHTILAGVGWTSTVITSGKEYTIATPDLALGAHVRVKDDGAGNVSVQFLSLYGTNFGALHLLSPRAGKEFQVWANCCQLFISVHGILLPDITNGFCSMAGGIPFVPPDFVGDCEAGLPTELTIELWWSNGDGNNFDPSSFRTTIVPGLWSACYNGTLMPVASTRVISQLRLFPKSIALPWGTFPGIVPRTRWAGTDEQLFFEPFIGWGTPEIDSPSPIRGQLWDCVLGSVYKPIDDEISVQGFDFINYMGDPPAHVDATRFSNLYLLKGVHSSAAGFGYIY